MNNPQPMPTTGKAWHTMTAEGRDEIDAVVAAARIADAQLRTDFMTIIDFCDAMARGVEAGENDPDPMLHAIRGAHDIAHVLEGGDSVTDWTSIRYVVRAWPRDRRSDVGPAWPDVRLRMADVLARAEEMTT